MHATTARTTVRDTRDRSASPHALSALQALAGLTEAQRADAMARFALLRPVLEDGRSQTALARQERLPLRTVQRWLRQYRQFGMVGLARKARTRPGHPRLKALLCAVAQAIARTSDNELAAL